MKFARFLILFAMAGTFHVSGYVMSWGTPYVFNSAPSTTTPYAASQTFTPVNNTIIDIKWTLTPVNDSSAGSFAGTTSPWVQLAKDPPVTPPPNPKGPLTQIGPIVSQDTAAQRLQVSYLSRVNDAAVPRNDGIEVKVEFFYTGTSIKMAPTGVSFNIFDIDMVGNDGGTWSYIDQITNLKGFAAAGGFTTPTVTPTSVGTIGTGTNPGTIGLLTDAAGNSTNGANGLTIYSNSGADVNGTNGNEGNVKIDFGASTQITGFSFIYNNRLGNVQDNLGNTKTVSAAFDPTGTSLDTTAAQIIALSNLEFVPEINSGIWAVGLCLLAALWSLRDRLPRGFFFLR